MTGDYPTTALSIARQAGLDDSGGFLTGEAIGAMKDEELRSRVRTATVFARVLPEHDLVASLRSTTPALWWVTLGAIVYTREDAERDMKRFDGKTTE